MNLLAGVPEWFTSWGWIVIVAAAVVVIAVVIALIVRAKKSDAVEEEGAEEAGGLSADEENEPVEEEETVADAASGEEEEEAEEEPAEEESAGQPAEEPVGEQSPAQAETAKTKAVNKTYHIAKRKADGKWQVKIAGGAKAIKLFNTQLEAIDFAKKLAENQEAKIVIHKEDGTFRRLTYHKKK